jgi:hypothetical protein
VIDVIAANGNMVSYNILFSEVADPYVTSTAYVVDQDAKSISGLPSGTTVGGLKGNLTPSQGATIKVFDQTGSEITEGNVAVTADDEVRVSKADKTVTYSIALTYNTDATLSALSVTGGPLDPAFNSVLTSYIVEVPAGTETVDISATPSDPKASVSGDVGTFNVPGTASVTVTAEDGTTQEIYSIQITVESTGIISLENGLKIYPNPAREMLIVETDISEEATVKIFNMLGTMVSVERVTGNRTTIELSGMEDGLYIMTIQSGDQTVIRKFIKSTQ